MLVEKKKEESPSIRSPLLGCGARTKPNQLIKSLIPSLQIVAQILQYNHFHIQDERGHTELISFLSTWNDEDMFLEDTYNNPIAIKRYELLELANQRYQAVMNDWHTQHQELKRVRKV